MSDDARPVPLLGDISLELVQRIEHSLDAGFASTPIAGLPGDLQQRTSRRSHRIRITGVLAGDTAKDDLSKLQGAAASGDEVEFSADISSALDLQKVVIAELRSSEAAGEPNRFIYSMLLVESPPLPPPAQLGGFGGFDGLGDLGLGDLGLGDLGDLGFDTDILGDLADMAGDIAGAVNDAMNAINALSALGNLDALNPGNLLGPIQQATDRLGALAPKVQDAMGSLSKAFGGGA